MTVRMYDDDEGQRARRLSHAIDAINKKLGCDTIHLGLLDGPQNWKTKFEMRSPRYTTSWNELLCVS